MNSQSLISNAFLKNVKILNLNNNNKNKLILKLDINNPIHSSTKNEQEYSSHKFIQKTLDDKYTYISEHSRFISGQTIVTGYIIDNNNEYNQCTFSHIRNSNSNQDIKSVTGLPNINVYLITGSLGIFSEYKYIENNAFNDIREYTFY